MLVIMGLSVPSNVVGEIKVPASPAKFEFGCKAESSRWVPGGTVPAVIFADKVRVMEDEMTEDINSLAVESEALASTERPASCWFNCRLMMSALALINETSEMPSVMVVEDEFVATGVGSSWAYALTLSSKSVKKNPIKVCFLYIAV